MSVCTWEACMTWEASVLSLSVCPLKWALKTSLWLSILSFHYPSSFFLYCFCLFSKPCLYLWICWAHSYMSRISTLRLDCTNYTSKLGNWISYSASGLERENTGIIVTDRDTPTLWCHTHWGPVLDRFPIDKSRFMMWSPWLFSPPKRFILFISWETAIWG